MSILRKRHRTDSCIDELQRQAATSKEPRNWPGCSRPAEWPRNQQQSHTMNLICPPVIYTPLEKVSIADQDAPEVGNDLGKQRVSQLSRRLVLVHCCSLGACSTSLFLHWFRPMNPLPPPRWKLSVTIWQLLLITIWQLLLMTRRVIFMRSSCERLPFVFI